MFLACMFGFHRWDSCKCTKCGKKRDKGHDWSKDCEKCAKCGKQRNGGHDWSKDCEKCAKCGKERSRGHEKEAFRGKCAVCGQETAPVVSDPLAKKQPPDQALTQATEKEVIKVVNLWLVAKAEEEAKERLSRRPTSLMGIWRNIDMARVSPDGKTEHENQRAKGHDDKSLHDQEKIEPRNEAEGHH